MRLTRLSAPDRAGAVTIHVDGAPVQARAGDTVATALFAIGVTEIRRSAVSRAPRAPYCLMGVCFECLVEIDGVPDRQACLVSVRDGMTVKTARGGP